MRKQDLQCEQCGQTWRWPSDMERAGRCVNCAAALSYSDNQQRGFVTTPTAVAQEACGFSRRSGHKTCPLFGGRVLVSGELHSRRAETKEEE